MAKKTQLVIAFMFGAVFLIVCIAFASLYPYPSQLQYVVVRVILALAAAGFATVLPGLIELRIGSRLKAAGALAIFCVVYFFNPAQLSVQGEPTNVDGLFRVDPTQDGTAAAYYWSEADTSFEIPSDRWQPETTSPNPSPDEITFLHDTGDAQIQMHVRASDAGQDPSSGQPLNHETESINVGGQPAFRTVSRSSDLPTRPGVDDLVSVSRSDGSRLDLRLTYPNAEEISTDLAYDYEHLLASVHFEQR